MGLELSTDRYPPITSQTRYPLRHAASALVMLVGIIMRRRLVIMGNYLCHEMCTTVMLTSAQPLSINVTICVMKCAQL